MLLDLQKVRIFIRPGVTDMRKQINGLSVLVEELEQNLFSDSLFLFCSRNRKTIKALYWDKTGFVLLQKRLEVDKFPWPKRREEVQEITEEELRMLLSGIDFFHTHRVLHYQSVS